MRLPPALAVTLGALLAGVVGLVSGGAATLIHHYWWGLGLGLVTALVVLAWLPPGPVRVLFAAGWLVAALRGAVEQASGGFLVASDAPGWSFLASSGVLLMGALISSVGTRPRPAAHAGDPGDRPAST